MSLFCFRAHVRLLTYVMLLHHFYQPRYTASFSCEPQAMAQHARQNQYISQPLSRARPHIYGRNGDWYVPIHTRLHATSLPDISGMRVGDIRKELESYGISTSSFLEKKDMVMALEKARLEGKTAVNGAWTTGNSSNSTSPNSATNTSTPNSTTTISRSVRLKEEMEKANAMKVGELKKELVALGVSTASFFEKTEFVKAYAEAVVDGKGKKSGRPIADDEPRDPEYRDVVLQKMVRGDPRQLQGTIIDVTAPRKR